MQIVIDDVEGQREKWHEYRSKTVGSSEVAVILGLNPYQTPFKLWAEKTGKLERQDDNDDMWLGRQLEASIGAFYERKTLVPVERANILAIHDDIKFASASPDFWICGCAPNNGRHVGILETKNVSARMEHHWEDGNVPNYAYVQLMWQLGVCGMPVGSIAALVGGSGKSFRHKEIEFDADIFNKAIEAAAEFMEYVKSDVPPAVSGNDVKLIQKLKEENAGKQIELPHEASELLDQYTIVCNDLKAKKPLEDKKEELRAKLSQMLGDAQIGVLGEYEVSLKSFEKKGFYVEPSKQFRFAVKRHGKAV